MNQIIQRIHDIGIVAWVRFVQALNWIAVTFGGIIIAFNGMFPKAVEQAVTNLPNPVKLAALALWAAMVHYALRRAAKAA